MADIKSVQLGKAVSIDGTEGRSNYEAGPNVRFELGQGLLSVFVTRTIADENGNKDVEYGAGFPLSGGNVLVVKYQNGIPPTQNAQGEAPKTLSSLPPTATPQGFDATTTVKKSEDGEKQREGVNEQRQKAFDSATAMSEATAHPEAHRETTQTQEQKKEQKKDRKP